MLAGLTDEFVRYGHEVDNPDCQCCRPDYPRRCSCQGLAHSHPAAVGWESAEFAYCCDRCGPGYREEPEVEVREAESMEEMAQEIN